MFPETKAEPLSTLNEEESLKYEAKNDANFHLPTAMKIPDTNSEISEGELLALATEKELKEVTGRRGSHVAFYNAEKRDSSGKLSNEETKSSGRQSNKSSTNHKISLRGSPSVWKTLRRVVSRPFLLIFKTLTSSVATGSENSSDVVIVSHNRRLRGRETSTSPSFGELCNRTLPRFDPPLIKWQGSEGNELVRRNSLVNEVADRDLPDSQSVLGNRVDLEKNLRTMLSGHSSGRMVAACKPAGALHATKAEKTENLPIDPSNSRTRQTIEQEIIALGGAIEAAEELTVRLKVSKTQEEVNQCIADFRAELQSEYKESFAEWFDHGKDNTKGKSGTRCSAFEVSGLRKTAPQDEDDDDLLRSPPSRSSRNAHNASTDEDDSPRALPGTPDSSKIQRLVRHEIEILLLGGSQEVAEDYAKRLEAAETKSDLSSWLVELRKELPGRNQEDSQQWLVYEQKMMKRVEEAQLMKRGGVDAKTDTMPKRKPRSHGVKEVEKEKTARLRMFRMKRFFVPGHVRKTTTSGTLPLAWPNLQNTRAVEQAIMALGGSKKAAAYWAEEFPRPLVEDNVDRSAETR